MLKTQMWMKLAPDLLTEWQQCMEEGKDVESLLTRCEEVTRCAQTEEREAEALAIAEKMAAAPLRTDYPYEEPSDLVRIRCSASGNVQPLPLPAPDVLRGKIAGAWIGRISGCLLGKPFECLRTELINRILKNAGDYPLTRYIAAGELPETLVAEADEYPLAKWKKCWIDRIDGKAPVDDDTNYTVMGMKLIDTYGFGFTPEDVAEGWLRWMPMFSACTAERVAYRNIASGMLPPETASFRNPYREWIGAQIRGDFFGYVNPGNPALASEMAWRDASISHTKNGIYAEMYIAAMIARAAVSNDMEDIVRTGLAQIPRKSRLAEAVCDVLGDFRKGIPQADVTAKIHSQYDEYFQHDWCHAISNAMIVTACLLYSGGDFSKAICSAVQTGFDTDCNGATVGSVMGMMLGEKAIPDRWQSGFGGILRTSIEGYHEVTVSQLVQKTIELIARETCLTI